MTYIPYGKQRIDQDDINAAVETLKSDWLTTGPKVREFEEKLAVLAGAEHAVAVNSGTSALELAVAALKLPEGSEIITTPLTFVADANCALFNGCVPVFADIKKDTFNIDPDSVRTKITKKTKAIVCVDYAGLPCDLDALRAIADEHSLYLIEDACHSIGGSYEGRPVGSLTDLSCFSFHPVKHITTAGEGGAITTDDAKLAERMRFLRNHGMDKDAQTRFGKDAPHAYDILELSRNFRITDVQCAVGITQLAKLDGFLERRQEIASRYDEAFRAIKGITPQAVPDGRVHAYHLYTVLLPEDVDRDAFFTAMRSKDIGVNVHYPPIYRFTLYRERFGIDPSEYPVTESVYERIITLPMHPGLTDVDVERVIDATIKTIEELRKS